MKIVSSKEALEGLKSGMSVMVGGFMTNGTPEKLIDAVVESGVRDLTVICNDGGYPDKGVGKLICQGLVKKLITSHIGLNPEAGKRMNAGSMEVQLIPQGTLAERVRAGGAGLGGFLTPTGVGTEVEEGKEVMEIEGKRYLLEMPLKADYALIRGSVVDEFGSVFYKGTTRNFNPIMATAARCVVVGAERVVPPGGIEKEHIVTPGIFVNYVVEGEL